MFGMMKVTSLEGYTFEGWKRFFMEALLYIEQRYYHEIPLNLDFVAQKEAGNSNLTNGLMTFGPKMDKNLIFNEIKRNTEYITENIIAFYIGKSKEKTAKIQLGGYEDSYAYGHHDGYLFYEIPLKSNSKNWILSVEKMICSREKSKQWDEYVIPV